MGAELESFSSKDDTKCEIWFFALHDIFIVIDLKTGITTEIEKSSQEYLKSARLEKTAKNIKGFSGVEQKGLIFKNCTQPHAWTNYPLTF